ncbi:MAG: type II toxin-antitoxin system prevent-host-death family antitoxin [Gemmatimonadaceae bacterium]
MRTISAFEAKTRFGELLARVAQGEEVVITKHDRPVARIVPEGRRSLVATRHAVESLRALQARIAKRSRGRAVLRDADVRSAIDAGRP